MEIVLRQKMVSLLASYTAKTDDGDFVAEVSQKLRLPASYEMYNADNELVYTLKGEFLQFAILDKDGNQIYTIRPTKKVGLVLSKRYFNFLKKELSIYDASGTKIGTAGGNWLAYSYKVKLGDEVVGTGKKKVVSFTDLYYLQFEDEQHTDLMLIIGVLFDSYYNSGKPAKR